MDRIPTTDPIGELFEDYSMSLRGRASDKRARRPLARRPRSRLDRLAVVVEEVNNFSERDVIGGRSTHIALKNPKSYLIGTEERGLKVIERDAQVFSGKLHENDRFLCDVVYCPAMNCYFLASLKMLYRKDINDRTPYRWMKIDFRGRIGAYLRYSSLNQRLMVVKGGTRIAVINPKTKKIEIVLEKSVGGIIKDFRVFGEQENRVVAVTVQGSLIAYSLDFKNQRGEVAFNEALKKMWEHGLSIAVCSRNEYVCVEIESKWDSCKMSVFRLEEESLVQVACLDLHKKKIHAKYALEFLGYADRHLLWVGLSWENNGVAEVYNYDLESKKLKELEKKREQHQENRPLKLHRLGDKLYYVGKKGKLMCLSVIE